MSTNQNQSQDDDQYEPGDRYGYTFALDRHADLKINRLNQPAEVFDEDAVIQDLKVALLTHKGEDMFRPEYGLNVFRVIGTSDNELRREIVRTIGPDADARVETIDQIDVDREGGNREDTLVTIHLTLESGQSLSFEFSALETVGASRDL